MRCINLLERWGRSYRIAFDASYDPKGVRRDKLDPWYMTIPCRYGTVYPVGGDRLAVEVDYRPHIAKRLAALPGVVLSQNGDMEKTFSFPVAMFEAVAAIVRPRRRRQVSEAQRQIGRAALAQYRARKPPSEAPRAP
jgi:hypothetical protein